MAYQEGDTSPPHTNVHNDVRTQLDQLSTEFEIPVVLPPVVGLGDVGHVDHHNLFTTAIAELSKHECEDGLEGLGGWAEITQVTGSPKRYAYGDWVAFEWTGDGSVRTTKGLIDTLMVGGGGGGLYNGQATGGCGGSVVGGLWPLSATTHTVTVGPAGVAGTSGQPASDIQGKNTTLGAIELPATGGAAFAQTNAGGNGVLGPSPNGMEGGPGFHSDITGNNVEYGRGGWKTGATNAPSTTGTRGWGGGGNINQNVAPATGGCVIVRVPAAQAAGVSAASWVTHVDYYAEVTDGIVTDLYQERFYGDDTVRTENGSYASPEQPDDLIPCDPSVAEGWTYADGEFTPPPPDPSWREEAIEALQEQIKELQKDTK